jgi:hypothetical protein
VIDAADNSIAAATSRGEECFVQDMLACRLPARCRLIVTARTHRLDDLGLPNNAVRCPIAPFTQDESNANLRRYFPDATDQQCEEFHRLSSQIPRVQGYALSKRISGLENTLSALRPDGKTVETLIDANLRTASLRTGDPQFFERVCFAMLVLPRPIPLKYLALLAAKDEQAILDFCNDMFPGLRLKGNLVSFADEDFEYYLRLHYNPELSLWGSLADILTPHSAKDSYAAAHLADILHRGKRPSQLIDLIYREKQPAAVTDPIERKEVFARRARLAMAAAIQEDRQADLIKLLIITAEAAKADQALEKLLLDHADLACRFGNPTTIQRLYLNKITTVFLGMAPPISCVLPTFQEM